MASLRIQCWALTLSPCDFDNITYKKGRDIPYADTPSFLPLPDLPHRDDILQELVLKVKLTGLRSGDSFRGHEKKNKM